jgi:putative N6-adenine-specific DNA methylase
VSAPATPVEAAASPAAGQTTWRLFAVVRPGLEPLLRAELAELLPGRELRELVGGLEWRGGVADLHRVARWSHLAEAIRVRVAEFSAPRFERLVAGVERAPWHAFATASTQIEVRATCHRSRLYHSDAVAERVREAIRARLADRQAARPGPGKLVVHVRLHSDSCVLSVDATGDRLHRRGYRTEVGGAPARETLAAAVVMAGLRAFERPDVIWDPFCGTGSLVIEAALVSAAMPPGARRGFDFELWPSCGALPADALPRAAWAVRCVGSDIDDHALGSAGRNADRAGVGDRCGFTLLDASDAALPAEPEQRLLVCFNPPYGDRLRGAADPLRRLRERLVSRRGPTAVAMMAPTVMCEPWIFRGAQVVADVRNGGIPVRLVAWAAGHTATLGR